MDGIIINRADWARIQRTVQTVEQQAPERLAGFVGGRARPANNVTFLNNPGGSQGLRPFEIYQFDAGVAETDPFTVRVRDGTASGYYPTGVEEDGTFSTDGQADPRNIIIPASQSHYRIWLACHLADGFPDAVALAVGNDGWSGYPAQPAGDPDTGAPPEWFYLELGYVVTGIAGITSLHSPQPIRTSVWVEDVGYNITCNNGFVLQRRMAAWSV